MELKVVRGTVRYKSIKYLTGERISDVERDIADFLLGEGVVEVIGGLNMAEASVEDKETAVVKSHENVEIGTDDEPGPVTDMPEFGLKIEPEKSKRGTKASK